jgi:aminomethyltransferase
LSAAGDRATVLLDLHRELGAKLTNFGGWDMPLQYEGVVTEHSAVRNSVGVFDVSHLGKLRLTGPDAVGVLDRAMTAGVSALGVGQAKYSLVLTDEGGCIDDVFVYRMDHEDWLVVPNASNVFAVTDAIKDAGGTPVDEWNRYSILAVQGPDSFDVFEKAFPNSGATDLKLHHWTPMDVFGERGFVARTGYTGERGFELYAPVETSAEAFRKLLDLGAAPVGLGARDTLRLEMGYALYGHEISLDINPLEAVLGWTLAWDSPFRGREALEKVKADGPARKLFGVVLTGRGVPRQGYPVLDPSGAEVGRVTSGNYSPSLGTGIALALGPRELTPAEGSSVHIEARGRRIPGDIVKPPFRKRDAA